MRFNLLILFMLVSHTWCLHAQDPMVVDMTMFDTIYNQETYTMDIVWETASEIDVAGFFVYRSADSNEVGARMNPYLIFAQGSPTIGASYSFSDEPDTSGRYYYKVSEISLSTGDEIFYCPSEYPEDAPEPDWDDFVKVFEDKESVVGGEYYWFNEGENDPGDGRQVSVIVTTTGVSGTIRIKQTNAELDNAPNTGICPWSWKVDSDVGALASIDFYYNHHDIKDVPETEDFLGIAEYKPTRQTWTWHGGSVYPADHKIRLDDVYPQGIFVLYRRVFGDITGDGMVDVDDMQKFGDVWNFTANGEFSEHSDARFFNYDKSSLDSSQIIDKDDFDIFQDNWGNGTPQ